MNDDPFWAQKRIERENRKRVLASLSKRPKGFTQLRNELGLSKPVLSKHLKFLKKRKHVAREVIDDRLVYKLTKGAFRLPLLNTLIFEDGVYARIQRELSMEREAFVSKERTMYQDRRGVEVFLHSELNPRFIARKSESEIVQAIDKWLTPVILYAILQELKTGDAWTETVHGITQKLTELVKQKDIIKFEKALRKRYSKSFVPKHFFLPSEKIPIIDSLDDIIEHLKVIGGLKDGQS